MFVWGLLHFSPQWRGFKSEPQSILLYKLDPSETTNYIKKEV
jgi:hypothetical protein